MATRGKNRFTPEQLRLLSRINDGHLTSEKARSWYRGACLGFLRRRLITELSLYDCGNSESKVALTERGETVVKLWRAQVKRKLTPFEKRIAAGTHTKACRYTIDGTGEPCDECPEGEPSARPSPQPTDDTPDAS